MRKVILLATLFSFSAQAAWVPYTVKKGDELGKVIQDLGFKQWLWGEKGLVKKVYVKNSPPLESSNLIIVGQVIYLPQIPEDLDNPLKEVSIYKAEHGNQPQAIDKQTPKTIYETELSEMHNTEKKTIVDKKRNATLSVGVVASLMDRSLSDKTTNASGTAQSDPIYGLLLISQFPLSKLWNIDSSLTYRKIDFASSQSRTFAVNSNSFLRFSLGASRELEKLNLGAGLVYEQLPIITGVSATRIGVSSVKVLSPYISADWNFYSWGKTNLNLEFLGAYNLSGSGDNINLASGFDTQVSLNFSRQFSESLSYSLVPFVQYGNKETETVDHSDVDIGMRLLINWNH